MIFQGDFSENTNEMAKFENQGLVVLEIVSEFTLGGGRFGADLK